MSAAWLRGIIGTSATAVRRTLGRFVETVLAVRLERRYYLVEASMRRAVNLSLIRPALIHSRHGFCFNARERRHDDGINCLAVARDGVKATAGWRGESNIPGLTEVRPDLLLLVSEGSFGPGTYALEYERSAAAAKLRTFRRAAAASRTLPVLFACETEGTVALFISERLSLPLLATMIDAALSGPLTREHTVWSEPGRRVRLRCHV